MADLGEAFNTLKFSKKSFHTIDHFFTQRSLSEDHEWLDKNMNRKTKKVKVIHNFLALNIPTVTKPTNDNGNTIEKLLGFDIEIFGDEGYHYKGTITSYQGIIPNFMIQIKGDKKLFVNINYKFSDDNQYKKYVSFIEVPKRFQQTSDDNTSVVNDTQSEKEIDL